MIRSLAVFIAIAACCVAQDCPIQFAKTDTTLVFTNPITLTLSTRIQNVSGKEIRGMKLAIGYFDAVEDLHLLGATTRGKPIPQGKEIKIGVKLGDISLLPKSKGWIIIPAKILFADGTVWQEPLKASGCWGEVWHEKKHPRVTKLPSEALADLDKGDSKKYRLAERPAFSPNSQTIFFQSDRNGKMAIYGMSVNRLVEETDDN